jgi:hypothetical protein
VKVRATVLVLSLTAVGAAGPALATVKHKPVKPVCNLIRDDKGDEAVSIAGPGVPGSSNEDIISGDIASNATTLTTVVRTAALAQPDPEAPLGQAFMFFFNTKGSDKLWFTSISTYPEGTAYEWGYRETGLGGLNANYVVGAGTGKVDTAKKEVRMSFSLAALHAAGATTTKGSKISGLAIETRRVLGQGVTGSPSAGGSQIPLSGSRLLFDDASGNSYLLGTPSCVTPGK